MKHLRRFTSMHLEPPSRRLLACAILTAIWSGPSLAVAWILRFHLGGALLGLSIYFGLLAFVATRPFVGLQVRRPVVRRALADAFAFRIATLAFFPVATLFDMICGGISVEIIHELTGLGRRRAELAVAATLLTGILLTAELVIVFVVSYYSWLARGFPSSPDGHCEACGYDLRGGRSPRCPECGAQNVPPNKLRCAKRGARTRASETWRA